MYVCMYVQYKLIIIIIIIIDWNFTCRYKTPRVRFIYLQNNNIRMSELEYSWMLQEQVESGELTKEEADKRWDEL